jgi:hypothetical protein
MPSLSLNVGLNNGRKLPFGGLDPDAAAYFTTAGVTDATAKEQINAFVKGVKNLGLWSSIVSWPLRSAQNAGTGTTAYSLGGLGTYNGTLTNGPTWGADGVVFDGVNDCITTTYVPPDGTASFGFASKIAITPTDNYIVYSIDNLTNRKMGLYYASAAGAKVRFEANLNGTVANRFDINSTDSMNFVFAQVSHDGTNFYGQGNNGTIQSVAGSGTMQGTGASLVFGRRSIDLAPLNFPGTIAFTYYISSSVNANFTNLYTLYKNTLGTGLGLP